MRYHIRAVRSGGQLVQLQLEAADALSARAQAEAEGLTVVSVRAQRSLSRGGQRFPVSLFAQELLALLRSGLSMVEGLEAMAEKEGRSLNRAVLTGLIDALRQGKPLSAAMGAQRTVFPDLLVAMVRASERTSDLDQALARFVAYREQVEVVRAKLISAATYPAILLLVGGLVVLFLLGFVVPQFSRVYEDISGDLPTASRWLLAWGAGVKAHAGVLAVVAPLGLGLAGWLLSRRSTWERLLAACERIPWLGERMRVFRLARFFRTVGMLLRGGIPAVPSLELVRELLPQPMQHALGLAMTKVREGRTVSDAFAEHGLTTPVASRMLRVGERAGNLGDMMERIAAFHDEEMMRWLDRATRLFGPLLMLAIGLFIAGVVVLMYLPMFQLTESIQ